MVASLTVCVVMVVVTTVVVIAVVVVVVNVLLWVAAMIDMVVVVEVLVIDVRADLVIDTLTGEKIPGVLADANVNVFASLMPTLEFAVPKP